MKKVMDRKSVLVAFQNSTEMEDIVRPLQTAGYRILQADSILTFFDALERYEIDLLITDVELPGVSMPALLPFMNQRYPLMKVIVVMRSYSPSLELDLRSHSVLYTMSWPVNGELLLSVVKKGLEHSAKQYIHA